MIDLDHEERRRMEFLTRRNRDGIEDTYHIADRETFYSILTKYIPSDMIDGIWQELKEAGVA